MRLSYRSQPRSESADRLAKAESSQAVAEQTASKYAEAVKAYDEASKHFDEVKADHDQLTDANEKLAEAQAKVDSTKVALDEADKKLDEANAAHSKALADLAFAIANQENGGQGNGSDMGNNGIEDPSNGSNGNNGFAAGSTVNGAHESTVNGKPAVTVAPEPVVAPVKNESKTVAGSTADSNADGGLASTGVDVPLLAVTAAAAMLAGLGLTATSKKRGEAVDVPVAFSDDR